MRLAVVTGGTRGIGNSIVKELCKKFDGTVLFTGREESECTRIAANFRKDGYDPIGHPLDLGDRGSIETFAEYVSEKFGGLDILVNNAAMAYKVSSVESFGTQAENTIKINFFGTLYLCNSLFSLLRPHARVVNVSSSAGMLDRVPSEQLRSQFLSADLTEESLCKMMDDFVFAAKTAKHLDQGWGGSAYAVSKVGVSALTFLQQKKFDKDERKDIIVNAVHPGYVDTEMTSHQGPLTPDQGAEAPSYLALLPPDVTEPKGQMVWNDKKVVNWTSKTIPTHISLVSIALDPQERQFRLWTLHQYCDKELAKVKSDLFQECRRSDEIGFFSCVEQLEVGEKCCSNAQTVECHHQCQQVFASKQTPNGKTRNAVTHSCSYHSPKVVKCVQDYVRLTPSSNPQRNLHCCEKSSNEHCTKTCIHAMRTKKTDQDIMDAIEAACGSPLEYAKLDKMWQCFLRHANSPRSRSTSISSINHMGLDSAKLQCCRKAVSVTCRKLCFKTFNNEWTNTWDVFDKQCLLDSHEFELTSCLTEVDEPCELGCEGLTYCTNFNDRPTELFQSCSSTADRAAKEDVSLWKNRYITMPNMQIPVVDITRCDPNMWKAVACTLQLKPCRPHRPTATICKQVLL
uniref:Uncharacterized protein n=1 Tax=Strigamia maritima TaxID=126957 RepID=T1IV60_STRMM